MPDTKMGMISGQFEDFAILINKVSTKFFFANVSTWMTTNCYNYGFDE
jgi:hypothetical protein